MSFDLEFEWTDPGRARGDDLRATWARLRIAIGDSVVSRVVDDVTRSERDGIYLPLLPLAEWLTQNWFFLFNEVGSRHTQKRMAKSHHLISSGTQGFALPELVIRPEGDFVELIWSPCERSLSGVTFIERGHVRLPILEVQHTFRNLISATVERLQSHGIVEHPLIDEWNAIEHISNEEAEFARAVSAIGMDPFDLDEASQSLIIEVAGKIPTDALYELLAITKVQELIEQSDWVCGAIHSLKSIDKGIPGLNDYVKNRSSTDDLREPHQIGYQMARELRAELGINGHPIRGLGNLAGLFQVDQNDAMDGIVEVEDTGRQIHAIRYGYDAPKILLTRKRQDSKRFALARSFFDYLRQPQRSVDLVSDSFLGKDKASRAFAAELLAPAEGLKHRIGRSSLNGDDVYELAEEFDVSTRVIEHQIYNHSLAEAPLS